MRMCRDNGVKPEFEVCALGDLWLIDDLAGKGLGDNVDHVSRMAALAGILGRVLDASGATICALPRVVEAVNNGLPLRAGGVAPKVTGRARNTNAGTFSPPRLHRRPEGRGRSYSRSPVTGFPWFPSSVSSPTPEASP
jgi:hypothetical protein